MNYCMKYILQVHWSSQCEFSSGWYKKKQTTPKHENFVFKYFFCVFVVKMGIQKFLLGPVPPPKKSSSPWPLSRSACWELPAEWAESAGQMLHVDSSNCLKNGASICLKSGLVSSGWLRLAGSDTGRLCAVTEENTISGCPASASVEPREEETNRPHGEIEEVWEGMRGR